MVTWVRRPSLEDYDTGNHLRFWANYVAARAHAPYDEEGACEVLPSDRSAKEAAADANAAEQRYQAYRERIREEEAELKAHAAKIKADQARIKAAKAAEWAERQRVQAEERARSADLAREADERRRRWLAENSEWFKRAEEEQRQRDAELQERVIASQKGMAFQFDAWGTGVYVKITKTTTVRWNGYPEGFAQRLVAGATWNVGKPLAMTLVNHGVGELLDG